jgi:uncharacterized protein (TIGR02001 family)
MPLFRASAVHTLFATAVLTMTAASTHAEINADLGLTSEYVRDGISQSSGNTAIQAGATATSNTGFYGGIWGSQVDRDNDNVEAEFDAFGGLYMPLSGRFAVDLGATRYTFHGDMNRDGDHYNEAFARILFKDALTLGTRYSDAYMGSDYAHRSLELGYTITRGTFSIELFTAQHRYLEIDDDVNYGSKHQDDYWQFRVGVGRTYNKWDYRFALDRTNLGREYDAGTSIQLSLHRYFNIW